jgi:outer membrane protein assembly factor BamA
MKSFALLISLLLAIAPAARAQEPEAPDGARIVASRVSGIDADDLSPELRDAISELVGQNVDRVKLTALAARIEEEQPNVVAAVRAPVTPSGEARVVFVVVRDRSARRDELNVNERYVIERVALDGVPDSAVSQRLRDDLQALVGTRLNRASRELTTRLREELEDYHVERRVSRGTQRGQVVLTYEARPIIGTILGATVSKFVYHEEQGWSGVLDFMIGRRDFGVAPRLVFDNRDDLVEEYSGFGVRVEHRRIGTPLLGAGLDISRYEPTWLPVTEAALAANPTLAPLYDRRTTVAPSVVATLPGRVRVTGGFSATDLAPLSAGQTSTMASVLTAGVAYDKRWSRGGVRHAVQGEAGVRSSVEAFGSEYDYTRVSSRGIYRARWDDRSTLIATLSAGRITGTAPLFERFTLGDTSTLRGWNKYDITPAGADGMWHGSVEYRFYGAAMFMDLGALSLQDDGTGTRWSSGVRASTGAGLQYDNFFATVGFPLNADGIRSTFMIGVKF